MDEPDLVMEHATTVRSNIRGIWPDLTDQDVQALSAWRWSAHRHRDAPDQTRAFVTGSSTAASPSSTGADPSTELSIAPPAA